MYLVCCNINVSQSNSLGSMVNDTEVGNCIMRKVTIDNILHLCPFTTTDSEQGEHYHMWFAAILMRASVIAWGEW